MLLAVRKVFRKVGIDGAIGFTILSRIIQAGGGLISVIFIAKFLSKEEQGYYYTFSSIIALQIFFELGLSGIITQYTAHEFAHLRINSDLTISGSEEHASRTASLLQFCIKWFGILALCLFLALFVAGYYFFSHYNNALEVSWKSPWLVLCLTTALNLFIDPILAFFDGLGMVKDISKVRLIQKFANTILLIVFFASGFGLYSAGLASLIAILINYFQIIFTDKYKVLKSIWLLKGKWRVSYYKEIFPFQWKIALSWISGYFIFYFFNPVLFATSGAVVAGQMGMTLAILSGISSISMSWINTKVPSFSSLISLRKFKILDDLFQKTLNQLTFVNFILIILLLLGTYLLYFFNINLRTRFLPIGPLILLCIVTFANQVVGSWGTYLRCYKREPFLIPSIVVGFLCACSTLIFGKSFGLNGMVVGYFSISMLVSLPWAATIFFAKKKQFQLG